MVGCRRQGAVDLGAKQRGSGVSREVCPRGLSQDGRVTLLTDDHKLPCWAPREYRARSRKSESGSEETRSGEEEEVARAPTAGAPGGPLVSPKRANRGPTDRPLGPSCAY